jgi:phage baseplate assembly protein V
MSRGIIETILNKIFLLLSRSALISVDNSESETQKIQIQGLQNETITDIERYQEYGFENYPLIANGEAITLFINGNRDSNRGINIRINNRKFRPTDLSSGDVCIYCKDSNDSNANRIWLKPTNNEIEIVTADGNDIVIDNTGITITDKNNNKIEMKSTGITITDKNNNTVTMSGTSVTVNSNLEVLQ